MYFENRIMAHVSLSVIIDNSDYWYQYLVLTEVLILVHKLKSLKNSDNFLYSKTIKSKEVLDKTFVLHSSSIIFYQKFPTVKKDILINQTKKDVYVFCKKQ